MGRATLKGGREFVLLAFILVARSAHQRFAAAHAPTPGGSFCVDRAQDRAGALHWIEAVVSDASAFSSACRRERAVMRIAEAARISEALRVARRAFPCETVRARMFERKRKPRRNSMSAAWPDIPYEPWRETCSALHL